MIQEVIVTTQNAKGVIHIAPMGIHVAADELVILPFRPSTTLSNILDSKRAVINFTDDVRIFAGCLTGRKDWPLIETETMQGRALSSALAYKEVELQGIEEDETRPKLFCKTINSVNRAPFQGFNRAQFAVLEVAILVSRLNMLTVEKIDKEIEYLSIGLHKTASNNELEAWKWLMEKIDQHKKENTPV